MFGTKISPRRRRVEVTLVGLTLALIVAVAGCGGSDDQEQAQSEQRHSMVPANLDTLISETGSDLPENAMTTEAGRVPADLSVEPAAENPEMLGATVPLVPETEAPESNPTRPSSQVVKTGTYSLQVGSFTLRDNAQSLATKVDNLGYAATIEQALVKGKNYHRVFVRGLDSRSAAENLGEELRASLGISYLVLRQP